MSDSDALLQHMTETATPDGAFGQNFAVTGGTIGWLPERVSAAMQELVADGKVEATHEGGDPTKIANSSWRVVEMPAGDPGSADHLDSLDTDGLRAFAEAHDIDLGDAKRKDKVRAAIDEALAERDAA